MNQEVVNQLFAPITQIRIKEDKSKELSGQIRTKKFLKLVLNFPGREFKEWLLKNYPYQLITDLNHFKKKKDEENGEEILPILSKDNLTAIYNLSIQGYFIKEYVIYDYSFDEVIQTDESENTEAENPNSDVIDESTVKIIETEEVIAENDTENDSPEEFELKNKVIILLEKVNKSSGLPNDFKPFAKSQLYKKFFLAGIFANATRYRNEICISTTQFSDINRDLIMEVTPVKTLDVKKSLIKY